MAPNFEDQNCLQVHCCDTLPRSFTVQQCHTSSLMCAHSACVQLMPGGQKQLARPLSQSVCLTHLGQKMAPRSTHWDVRGQTASRTSQRLHWALSASLATAAGSNP